MNRTTATYPMNQATAVVLDPNRQKRDELRLCLAHCGVLPICFDDEWICLENIFHIKPVFAVLRTISPELVIHFICVARVIEKKLPVIVITDVPDLKHQIGKPWMNSVFFLSFPVAENEVKKLIDSFRPSQCHPPHAGSIDELPVTRLHLEQLRRIGLSNEPVLIEGEPGVEKRTVARTIHDWGAAREKKWKMLSARDISGAWIRGLHQKIEKLPQPDSRLTSYVIEDIEMLSDQMQSQLLPIMDLLAAKGSVNGSGETVRLIFLSGSDLSYLNRIGQFRKDLYYRLTVLKINVPPLRNRRHEISLLADFFAAKYSIEKLDRLLRVPDDIQAAFREYDWPGNVAQLEQTIKQAVVNGVDSWVDRLNQWHRNLAAQRHCLCVATAVDIKDCLRKLMDDNKELSLKTAKQQYVMRVEKKIIRTALHRTHGNCKKAANLLDISYKSMLNKVKAYQLLSR